MSTQKPSEALRATAAPERQRFALRPITEGNATTATYVSGGDVIYVLERLLLF